MKPLSLAVLVVAVFATGFLAGRMSIDGGSGSSSTAAAPMAPMAAMPTAMPMGAPPQEAGNVIQGTVAEVIQVPNYTYLRLSGSGGDVWAAVPTTSAVSMGQSVSIAASTQMANFTSKTLNRTFETIWFGDLAGAGGAAPMAPQMGGGAAMPPGHPPMNAGGSGAAGALEAVKRAEGALSLRVADVYTERQLLAGRAVRVKGTVTKVTTINGKTYAHLSDGSGTKESKDDDLTVILSAEVKQNDQVTAEGTIALDKDLGAGHVYPVVLDAAAVVGK